MSKKKKGIKMSDLNQEQIGQIKFLTRQMFRGRIYTGLRGWSSRRSGKFVEQRHLCARGSALFCKEWYNALLNFGDPLGLPQSVGLGKEVLHAQTEVVAFRRLRRPGDALGAISETRTIEGRKTVRPNYYSSRRNGLTVGRKTGKSKWE